MITASAGTIWFIIGVMAVGTYLIRLSFILLASEDEAERTQAREALEKAAKDDPAVAGRHCVKLQFRASADRPGRCPRFLQT